MSRKRQNTSSPELASPPSKRHRAVSIEADHSSDDHEEPAFDPSCGQTGAFPGLADDGVPFYGPAYDGLDYLRMVRSEAHSLPLYLSASTLLAETYHSDNHYEGFFDNDEAFVALPISKQDDIDTDLSKAQHYYHQSLLDKFQGLKIKLNAIPPLAAVNMLPEGTPISFPPSSRSARQAWDVHIQNHTANPVQIACMDVESTFELLRLITRKMRRFLQSSKELDTTRLGTWIWALLGRCPDRGQLGSEEISDLRACAKAADKTWQWLQRRQFGQNTTQDELMSDPEMETDTEDNTGDVVHPPTSRGDDAVDESKIALGERIHVIGRKTIILDMIITIVGEAYGQRDLLELQRPWAKGG